MAIRAPDGANNVMMVNIYGSDDQRGDSNVDRECEVFQCGSFDCDKMVMMIMYL